MFQASEDVLWVAEGAMVAVGEEISPSPPVLNRMLLLLEVVARSPVESLQPALGLHAALNPKPQTLNPKPETRNPAACVHGRVGLPQATEDALWEEEEGYVVESGEVDQGEVHIASKKGAGAGAELEGPSDSDSNEKAVDVRAHWDDDKDEMYREADVRRALKSVISKAMRRLIVAVSGPSRSHLLSASSKEIKRPLPQGSFLALILSPALAHLQGHAPTHRSGQWGLLTHSQGLTLQDSSILSPSRPRWCSLL